MCALMSVQLAVDMHSRTFVIADFIIMDVKQSATSSLSANATNGCPVLCSTEYGSTDSSPSGEHGLCTDNPENAGDDARDSANLEVANTIDAPSSSVRPTSPDLTCPICLGRLENRSYTDTCFHKFCFVCLVEWSKVKPVCPLCKQPFTSVIHNVQSYENFEQLPITPGNSGMAAVADSNRSRFRYPTTVVHGSSERRRQRDLLQRPSRMRRRGSSRFDVPPPAFTSSYRRSIYRDELWVRSVEDSGRYRDASAAFFSRNPAAVHRLMPWLNRELMALLHNPADVTFLLEVILSTVLRVDITSETFYDLVAPFLGARTRHFIHEFYTFARSPFNMEAYDTRVIYERPPQIASNTPIEFSDSSSSDSSDAEIVEINPLLTADESNLVINDDEDVVNEDIFSLGESVENVNRNVSSPQPGPSNLQDIPLPQQSRQLFSSPTRNISVSSLQHPSTSSLDRQDVNRNMENVDEDSDDNVEIVAEDRPWTDRSPIVVSSSDTDADNAIELLQPPTDIHSSVDTHLSVDSSQVVFPISQHRTVDTDSSENDITELAHFDVRMNRAEITVAVSIAGSIHGSNKSSRESKHQHKKVKKRKHRHHRDSSHHRKDLHEPHSSSSGQHKKHKQQSQRLKPSGDIMMNNEREHKLSSSVKCTERLSDTSRVDSQVWLSDDSSDSPDCQRVRSVVVVPQTFKKNSTGHKRSTRDLL